MWQREGLETPPAVEEATRAYRSEMDVGGKLYPGPVRGTRGRGGEIPGAVQRVCELVRGEPGAGRK